MGVLLVGVLFDNQDGNTAISNDLVVFVHSLFISDFDDIFERADNEVYLNKACLLDSEDNVYQEHLRPVSYVLKQDNKYGVHGPVWLMQMYSAWAYGGREAVLELIAPDTWVGAIQMENFHQMVSNTKNRKA